MVGVTWGTVEEPTWADERTVLGISCRARKSVNVKSAREGWTHPASVSSTLSSSLFLEVLQHMSKRLLGAFKPIYLLKKSQFQVEKQAWMRGGALERLHAAQTPSR